MLSLIRKNADSIWVKGGLCVVASTFLFFFGMSDVVNKITGNDYVLKVGDVKIGPNLFKFELRKRSEKLKKLGITDENQVLNIVLNQMVNEEIIEQMNNNFGFFVGEDLVKAYMYSIPMFRNKDGSLNRAAIRTTMSNMELREGEFLDYLRKNIRHTLTTFPMSMCSPKAIGANYITAKLENRDVRYFYIPYNTFNITESYNDEDLEECYKANTDQFMIPETRDFSVIMIEEEPLLRDITVTEDEVLTEYKARSESEDLDKVHDEIHAYLVGAKLESKINEIIRSVEDDFASGVSCKEIIEKHNLKSSEFKGIRQDYVARANSSTSLPFMDSVMKAAFALELNQESSFIEGLDRANKKVHWLVRNDNIVPAHPKNLADVKNDVIKIWEKQKQRELAIQHVKGLVDEIDAGTIIDYTAEKYNYKLQEVNGLSRGDKASDSKFNELEHFDDALISNSFNVATLHGGSIHGADGVVVFEVINSYAPAEIDDKKVVEMNKQLASEYINELFLQMKHYYAKKLGVKTNKKLLKSSNEEYVPDVDF